MEPFGKYQLVRRIGAGGMAEVFLASTQVAQGLAKQLVIKKIHPAFARSRQFMSMFVDEAKIALGLNHPNIVQVFDFGQIGDTFFLAMEYVEGVDLLRVMQEAARARQPMPLGLCALIVQQVSRGLDYAHRKTDDYGEPLQIVHRDISPQNILLSWDGAVKIVDFGIARASHVDEEEGVVKGKFAYMAPEQARGQLVDRRADVFSAGVVLFELCCGRPLFPGKGKDVLDKVKSGAIVRPRDVNVNIPNELDDIILKALSFDPKNRHQTGRDLQNALGEFQLHWAQTRSQGLVDSGSLAQYLSTLFPRELRQRNRFPRGTPLSAKVQRPPVAEGTDSTLKSVGADSRDDSQAGTTASRREVRQRKPVFVIRCSMRGTAMLERRVGVEDAARVVNDFVAVARDVAYKHDAELCALAGSSFTAVVGVPVAAEDDPSRAISLALALIDALDGIGNEVEPELRLAVGIQRGVAMVTRWPGARYRFELAESTTEIANRLAEEAQGAEVLVGGAVYRAAREEWNFEPITTIDLGTQSGRETSETESGTDASSQERVRIYRLRGKLERKQRVRGRQGKTRVVGRALELKALRDAYRDVLVNGSHRIIAVIGESGLGKRTLVHQLLDSISGGEATQFRAQGRAATCFTPFGIISDFARDILGLAEGAEPREIQRRLDLIISTLYPDGPDDAAVSEGLDAVYSLLGVPRQGTRTLEKDELRARLVSIALRLERRLAPDKPLIIFAENCHWADEQSIALCVDLTDQPHTRGLMILLTARPEPSIIKVAAETKMDIMRLEELDEDARLELVMERLVRDPSSAELAVQIVARAGGNPLFLTELIDSLADQGILVPDQGESTQAGLLRWTRQEVPLQIPSSIESLLAARIDQLADDLKETIIRASVLGSHFTAAELEPMLGRPVNSELDALVQHGFLARSGQGLAFKNEMTIAAAYRMLPEDERRFEHLRVARRMLNSAGYAPARDDAIIARHLELAGDNPGAAAAYLKAAAHAVDVGSNLDAYRQLTRALRLLPLDDHERRCTAHLQRAEILRRLARPPERLADLKALLEAAQQLDNPAILATAHTHLAEYYVDEGKVDRARSAADSALDFAEKAGDVGAQAQALRLQSTVLRLQGRSDEALALCDQALELVGGSNELLRVRALILNARGTTLWNMDRLNEAIEAYAEGLVIYRALGLPRYEARSLNNMGIVCSAIGEPEEALAHFKSALKIDQKLGDRAQIALKLGNIGQVYSELGDDVRGERYLTKAMHLAEAQSSATIIDVLGSLGQLYLGRGDLDRATELLERARQLASDNENRYQEIRALVYLCLVRTEVGDSLEEALELAQTAVDLARAMPMPVGEMFGLSAQARVLAAQGKLDEAVEFSRRALVLLGECEQDEGKEQILLTHSELCESAGHMEDARDAIRKAHDEVERKLAKLTDAALRKHFQSAPTRAAILSNFKRLVDAS